METLKTIQTLGKIGRILSKIAFILALISGCICAAGLICLPLGAGEIFKIGGVSVHGLLDLSEGSSIGSAAVALCGWLVICAGEAVLARFAQGYFTNELAAGTPFTLSGAKELMRLGILAIALSLGSVIVSEIIQGILSSVLGAARAEVSFDPDGAVTLGVMFIVTSLLCRYGAELTSAPSAKELPEKEQAQV